LKNDFGHYAKNDNSGKTGWGEDLKMCTKVIGRDFHQLDHKFPKNISSPVMSKDHSWFPSTCLKCKVINFCRACMRICVSISILYTVPSTIFVIRFGNPFKVWMECSKFKGREINFTNSALFYIGKYSHDIAGVSSRLLISVCHWQSPITLILIIPLLNLHDCCFTFKAIFSIFQSLK
jgi:hypothetical protein